MKIQHRTQLPLSDAAFSMVQGAGSVLTLFPTTRLEMPRFLTVRVKTQRYGIERSFAEAARHLKESYEQTKASR